MDNKAKATPRPLSYQEELCHIGSILGFSPDMGNGIKKSEAVMKALRDARKSNEALLENCKRLEQYASEIKGHPVLTELCRLTRQAIAQAETK